MPRLYKFDTSDNDKVDSNELTCVCTFTKNYKKLCLSMDYVRHIIFSVVHSSNDFQEVDFLQMVRSALVAMIEEDGECD